MIEIKNRWTGEVIYTVKSNIGAVDLRRAKLMGADLRGAHLRNADLSKADLRWADLSGADLLGANLSEADLSGAELIGTKLVCVDLRKTNLSMAKSDKYQFIGIYGIGRKNNQTLFIPEMNRVFCGSSFMGSLAEFEAKVKETHKDNSKHLADYMAAIAYFKHFKPC